MKRGGYQALDENQNYTINETAAEEPKDRFYLHYFTFLMLGCSSFTFWKAFITPYSYFENLYPTFHFEFWFPAFYWGPALPMLIFGIKVGPRINRSVKLMVGLSYFMISLTMVPLLPKIFENNSQTTLWTTLPGVLLGGACSGVVFSTVFGFAASFPPLYTQAVMTGQSVSGILTILVLVICKAIIPADSVDRVGSYAFFWSNAGFVLISTILYWIIRQSSFTRYHLNQALLVPAAPSSSDETPVDLDSDQNPTPRTSLTENAKLLADYSSLDRRKAVAATSVLSVVKRIWMFPLLVFGSFFITASLWPGLVLMTSPSNGDSMNGWFKIIVVACFCAGDFAGRFLTAPIARFVTKPLLILAAFLRLGFYPLVILQNHPRLIHSDVLLFIVGFMLPFSSGFVGGSAMMMAPEEVKSHERETAGTVMTFALNGGIVFGTGAAILLLYLLTGSVWSAG